MPGLFDPITYGSIEAKNRILMAPLTRGRATKEGIPTDIMVEYYAQRASAGVIISEATAISRMGHGWPYAPGRIMPQLLRTLWMLVSMVCRSMVPMATSLTSS